MSDPGPWTSPMLRAAWARRDWPAIFLEYRTAAGLTQRQLEPLVGMAQPYIHLIEHGHKTPTKPAVITRITQGLKVPPELTGVRAMAADTPSEWEVPPELRERIAHAQTRGRPDLRVADWIADVLARHRRSEDQEGGPGLWPVVKSQLETITRLIPDASGEAADSLLGLAAEHAHWLSWVCAQEDRPGPALGWLDLAHGWAIEAGQDDLTSWLTRVRSYYMLGRGDPKRALRTARASRFNSGALSPGAESIAAHAEAMATAGAGDTDGARRIADQALELALQATDEGERPDWLYWLDPVRAHLHRADLAYAVRHWTEASEGYAQVLDQLTDFPRDHAYYAERYRAARSRV